MIIIDDLVDDCDTKSNSIVEIDGTKFSGWQIAKPLNYNIEHLSMRSRLKMVKLILQGKAIAVQYFSDLTEDQRIKYVKNKMGKI